MADFTDSELSNFSREIRQRTDRADRTDSLYNWLVVALAYMRYSVHWLYVHVCPVVDGLAMASARLGSVSTQDKC